MSSRTTPPPSLDDHPRRTASAHDAEQITDEICAVCGERGQVYVRAFRWNAAQQLKFHCHACGAVHVLAERRRVEPSDSAANAT